MLSQEMCVGSIQIDNNVKLSANRNRIKEMNGKKVSGFSKSCIPCNKGKTRVYTEEMLSKLRKPKAEARACQDNLTFNAGSSGISLHMVLKPRGIKMHLNGEVPQ
jgi:hypothetical protein